jgi:hypothetical protein
VFGVRWDDLLLYHLELNTSKPSTDQAAQIIAHAALVLSPAMWTLFVHPGRLLRRTAERA